MRRLLVLLLAITLVRCASAIGVLDPSFNVGSGPDGPVLAVLPLPNGQLLVGGLFTSFNGVPRAGLVRLNENGGVDTSFNAALQPLEDECGVTVLKVDAQNRIYVGGVFSGSGGSPRAGLLRLDADGRLDATFVPALPSPAIVASLALAADGSSLWVGGLFPGNGVAHSLWRLQLNGATAPGFVAPVFG